MELQIRDVSKTCPNAVQALKGVTLRASLLLSEPVQPSHVQKLLQDCYA